MSLDRCLGATEHQQIQQLNFVMGVVATRLGVTITPVEEDAFRAVRVLRRLIKKQAVFPPVEGSEKSTMTARHGNGRNYRSAVSGSENRNEDLRWCQERRCHFQRHPEDTVGQYGE